jgi:hypothetical protein
VIEDRHPDEPSAPKPAEHVSRGAPRTRKKRGDDLSIDMNWQPAGGDDVRTRTRGRPADATASFVTEFQQMAFLVSPGPRSYTEAVTGPDAVQWKAAIAVEMKALQGHEVFDMEIPRNLPTVTKVVDSKWILTIKLTVEGEID